MAGPIYDDYEVIQRSKWRPVEYATFEQELEPAPQWWQHPLIQTLWNYRLSIYIGGVWLTLMLEFVFIDPMDQQLAVPDQVFAMVVFAIIWPLGLALIPIALFIFTAFWAAQLFS